MMLKCKFAWYYQIAILQLLPQLVRKLFVRSSLNWILLKTYMSLKWFLSLYWLTRWNVTLFLKNLEMIFSPGQLKIKCWVNPFINLIYVNMEESMHMCPDINICFILYVCLIHRGLATFYTENVSMGETNSSSNF